MAEPTLSMTADDDLPRTILREREAREREAREREARERERDHELSFEPTAPEPRAAFAGSGAGVVTDFDVPFARLMTFFIKAVFAAIPAMLLLTALLWLFGQALQGFFPQLLKMKVDIQIYAPQSAADFRAPPTMPAAAKATR
jgi:hypothetical protein